MYRNNHKTHAFIKKHRLSLLALCLMGEGSAFAQGEIVVGDMNDDGQLTVGDVTALSETVVGRKAMRLVAVSGTPVYCVKG